MNAINMENQIINFYRYDHRIAAGGQPTPEQIQGLKDEGVEVLVSISPTSTKNYLPEEALIAESLQLHFIHFPIDCGKLEDIHYKTFKSILDSLQDKNIFVHCGGNIKTSNLIHMYQVLEKGIDEKESLEELKKIQQPEEKWFAYFKKMGMQGLN
jgi:protein tyrosine phosphatase (PTP) superfamily phosphohydrolase (DUF442 family)